MRWISKSACFVLLALTISAMSASLVSAQPALPGRTVALIGDLPLNAAGENYVKGRDVGSSFIFGGERVFLFGDTSLNPGWLVNTMYRTADTNADDNINGGFNYPAMGQVPQQFIPTLWFEAFWNNDHAPNFLGFWPPPQSVFSYNGKTYTWFDKVVEDGGDCPAVGSGLAEITALNTTAQRNMQHRTNPPVNSVSGVP